MTAVARWALVGAAGVGLLATAGSLYVAWQGSRYADAAEAGAAYLRQHPALTAGFGSPFDVRRRWFGSWSDGERATFTYAIDGPKDAGEADVVLLKYDGAWYPIGGDVHALTAGRTFEIARERWRAAN